MLMANANKLPMFKDRTKGMLRRIYVIPMTVEIPEIRQDKTLPQKLKDERSGILNWMLDGRDKYVLPEMTQGRDAIDVMRDERRRESRITAGARVLRFSYGEVIKEERFTQMLTLYGIPRGAARRIGG